MIINNGKSCMRPRWKFILIAATMLLSIANGKSPKESPSNFDCHDSITQKIDFDSDLVINNSNISTENLLISFNNKYVLKETKSNPDFCFRNFPVYRFYYIRQIFHLLQNEKGNKKIYWRRPRLRP